MPLPKPDAESVLRKLGQRLRQGLISKYPMAEKDMDTLRTVVREQWEQQRKGKMRQPSPPAPSRSKTRNPPEPER